MQTSKRGSKSTSQASVSDYRGWLHTHTKSVNSYGRLRYLILQLFENPHRKIALFFPNHSILFAQGEHSQEGI